MQSKNERFVALRYAELTPGPANIEAIAKDRQGHASRKLSECNCPATHLLLVAGVVLVIALALLSIAYGSDRHTAWVTC